MSEDHEIGEKVHKKLYGRRYLIVMDDIWSIEVWDKVKVYFPNNNNGSKIMITTRNSNLAFQLSGSHDFQMKFFDDDKSWDLLCKVVFGEEGCPIELENIGKRIARNCRGLPLSIVVVGGLLKKSNMTHEYWESTLQNLNPVINLENNEHCLQILGRSYKELAMHLKPCFLYMGVFPEDYRIKMSCLVKLWVVEGFLKPIENKSSEEVAKEYVKELIERNLIIVHDLEWNGKVASCIIHDLLRDLCLREARKQRFLCILRPQDQNIPEDINTVRRICIHHKTNGDYPRQFIHAIESAPLTRSLILVNRRNIDLPLPSSTCRLLRVYFCLTHKHHRWFTRSNGDIRALSQQANLRYLSLSSLRNCTYSTATISWNLQTLEVDNYSGEIEFAPFDQFWKMYYLRHVYYLNFQLPDPPCGEDHEFVLENLQTLSISRNFKYSEEMIKRIPNIKKLKVLYEYPINNLCHLRNLTSLHLENTFPNTFPDSLKKLHLRMISIPWEDITSKIGSLPLLESLILDMESCVGPEWETIEGQFHSLKFLRIRFCDLKCWMTDGTHFPRLERLCLYGLFKLEEIPLSIGDIPTLQSIRVNCCSRSAYTSAERIKEEQVNNGNEDLQIIISETL